MSNTSPMKLTIYSALERDRLERVARRFNQKHPEVVVEHFWADSPLIVEQFLRESKSGVHHADVVSELNCANMEILRKEDLLLKYRSRESPAYPDSFKDREGYWNGEVMRLMAIGYNTNLVRKNDVPRSFEDLLSPAWKRKILVEDCSDISLTAYWYATVRKKNMLSKSFFRKLAKQVYGFTRNNTVLLNALARGAGAISVMVAADRLEQFKAKGLPVAWVRLNPLYINLQSIAIPANAPHPEAAKMWVNFVLSNDGQSAVGSEISYPPARPGLEPTRSLTKGLDLLPEDPSIGFEMDKWTNDFSEVFGFRYIWK